MNRLFQPIYEFERGCWICLCLAPIVTLLMLSLLSPVWAEAEDDASWANRLVVHNKGVGGHNSHKGLSRFERDVVALKPDFVLIYFGINDALNSRAFVSEEKFIENLDAMITAAQEAGITPLLATIHHVGVEALLKRHNPEPYGEEGPQNKVDRYNKAIRELAAKREVSLTDWCQASDAIKSTEEGTEDTAVWRQPDGVHLTTKGNEHLAQCFYQAMRKDLRDGQTIVCFGDSVTFGVRAKGQGTATGETYPAYLRRIRLEATNAR